jgi:uncharacterized protein YoxC
MDWSILIYITASLALLALTALFIYLINIVRSSRTLIDNGTKAVNGLVSEIGALRGNLQGTIQNLEGVSGQVIGTVARLNQSVDRVNVQLDDATEVVHGARKVVVSLLDLEQTIQTKVQEPLVEMLSVFSAFGKGIRAFRRKLGGDSAGHSLAARAYDDK